MHFVVGNEGPRHPGRVSRTRGEVEHVALAEERFGAHLVEDGTGVDLAGNLKGHTRGDIGLDQAGDDINARTLRCEDKMDARARAFCARRAISSSTFADHHHKVRRFVDDHHHIGHMDQRFRSLRRQGKRIGQMLARFPRRESWR